MTAFRRFFVILLALALLFGCNAPDSTTAQGDSVPPSVQDSAADSTLPSVQDSAADSAPPPVQDSAADSALPSVQGSAADSVPPPVQDSVADSALPPEAPVSQPESSEAEPEQEPSSSPASQPPARATKDTWALPAGYEELDDDPYPQAAEEMFDGINAIRKKNGLPALRRNGILDCSATLRAIDLDISTEEQFYAHLRPDNARWSTAFDELGITFWSSRGENLGMVKFNDHAEDWQMMTDAWEQSPDHFENIVTESFTDIGIGIYRNRFGRYFVCTHFASFA